MRTYFTLTRRELAAYFLSLTGYIIVATAAFLMSLSFVVLMQQLRQRPQPMPITEMFYVTHFFWLILVLVCPIITMRLFALERATGTYETLMTTPVSELQVVMAKFSAAAVVYTIMWLPLIPALYILRRYSGDPSSIDPGALGATYLGILLMGGLFLSLGCLASAVTRTQSTAGMLGLFFGASVFLLGYLIKEKAVAGTGWQAKAMAALDVFQHMWDFSRGIVDTRPIVLLVSLSFFFLFLTLRFVESRRWK